MESTNAPRSTYPIPKMALSDAEYFFFFAFCHNSTSYNPSPSFSFLTTQFTKIKKNYIDH